MDTIIAATDFSKPALNAVKFAAAIAAETKSRLMVVHVMGMPFNPTPLPFSTQEFEEIGEAAVNQMDKLKEQLLFYTDNKIEIRTELCYGLPENVLGPFCDKVNPFAMVLGLEKNSSEKSFIGSTALRVLPHMHCPVLIVPENAVFSGIRSIAIAADSEHIHGVEVMQSIQAWLKAFRVSPEILHVNTTKEGDLGNASGSVYLYNHLKEFDPVFHSVNNNNIEEGIFSLIEKKKPDLLMVVPGRYPFFKKIFHESNSKKLILHSHLPVLALASDSRPVTNSENTGSLQPESTRTHEAKTDSNFNENNLSANKLVTHSSPK